MPPGLASNSNVFSRSFASILQDIAGFGRVTDQSCQRPYLQASLAAAVDEVVFARRKLTGTDVVMAATTISIWVSGHLAFQAASRRPHGEQNALVNMATAEWPLGK